MNLQACKAEIRKARAALGRIEELMTAASSEPAEPVEPEVPSVDAARRELRYAGKTVRLTLQEFRLAALLLQNAGSEVGYSRIDELTRGPDAPEVTVGAIQSLMRRFRATLQNAGLGELAGCIHRGLYRSYVWEPGWRSCQQMSTKISKGVRPVRYTSGGAKRRKEKS